WFVNALVFAGILITVLAAIEVAKRVRLRRPALLYVPLLASLAVAWTVPQGALLGLSFWPRFVAATALAFAPVFLANLVFAERFRDVGSSTVAFGANLLGAMVGGVLEYSALITGYRALLPVVAVLYLLALGTGRRYLAGGRAAPPPAEARARGAVRAG
ncbi:MAG: spermidine synthase, partial [Actinobacteria bacterium]|nr:spermidine synthase [Actinomycetota bacterium]